jgi:hypothetical protein
MALQTIFSNFHKTRSASPTRWLNEPIKVYLHTITCLVLKSCKLLPINDRGLHVAMNNYYDVNATGSASSFVCTVPEFSLPHTAQLVSASVRMPCSNYMECRMNAATLCGLHVALSAGRVDQLQRLRAASGRQARVTRTDHVACYAVLLHPCQSILSSTRLHSAPATVNSTAAHQQQHVESPQRPRLLIGTCTHSYR